MKKHNFTGYVDGKEMSALLIFYTNNEIQKLWMLLKEYIRKWGSCLFGFPVFGIFAI